MAFEYVYLLSSSNGTNHYVGRTKDLKARLQKHNAGEVSHTAKFRPWRIKIAIAFVEKPKAISFERYLKSHSGRAFAKRHF